MIKSKLCEECNDYYTKDESGLCEYCLFELMTCGYSNRPDNKEWNEKIKW